MRFSLLQLLSRRSIRAALLVGSISIAIAYLFIVDITALRVLGVLTAIVVTVLLKAVLELTVQSKRLRQDQERADSTRSLVDAIERRAAGLESAVSGLIETSTALGLRGEERLDRFELEINQRFAAHGASIDSLLRAHEAPRRHVAHSGARLRELSLSESLDVLVAPKGQGATPSLSQELGENDPGTGGSMSTNA